MKKKILVICMVLSIIFTLGINKVSAASEKVLSINFDHIQQVGNQLPGSVSCACYTMAYCRTILDNKVHHWYEYNCNNDKDEFNALAQWSRAQYNSKYVNTKQEAYKAAYDSINKGRPIVFRVLGKYQHYVTIVGYTNVTDVNKLDTSNFLMIDSIPNSTKSEVTNLKEKGYSLYSSSSGYRYIYTNTNGVVTINPNQSTKATYTYSELSVPEHLIKGHDFIVKGIINSNINISKVTLSIKDTSSKKTAASVSKTNSSKTFNIKNLASSIDLSKLNTGNYQYIIDVTDSNNNTQNVLTKSFKVLSSLPFDDIPSDKWYKETIEGIYSQGLMSGVNELLFKPDDKMTRGMVATVLYRCELSPKTAYGKYFSDVDKGYYYSIPITWAKRNNVVNGYTDGTFRPAQSVTREEFVTILCNYVKQIDKYKKADISLTDYKDYKSITPYAKESMQWAITNNIISGKDNGTRLDPKGKATRAECAKMLLEVYQLINK